MDYTPTGQAINKVKRMPARAAYDAENINSILDKGIVAHVGFEDDWPYVIPMAYGRIDDVVYLHGHVSARIMKALGDDNRPKVCVTVTHVDGLVLALTPFHNSMNYRSCCVFGNAKLVTDDQEKTEALTRITDHALDGSRWDDSILPRPDQLKSTSVIRVKIDTASAKIRTGPPKDDKRDIVANAERQQPYWTGVIPITSTYGKPLSDSKVPIPNYVSSLTGQSL